MGIYINKGNMAFQRAMRPEYVDKSGLICVVNNLLFTEQQFSCVTRCRRFGKSMVAKMLAAYYDCSCDSRALFADLEIAGDPSFEEHLNKYPVLYLDMTSFISRYSHDQDINGWAHVADALRQSKALLRATLDGDEQAVARAIDAAHSEQTSILSYNNENSMACVLSIAYYYAHGDYIIHCELATGRSAQSDAYMSEASLKKGFADLVFIPRKNVSSPAMVVELKYDHAVETAIDQIKLKRYPEKLQQYTGDVLLVGISYDREAKTHSCQIERL